MEYTGEKDTYIRHVMEAFEVMVDSRIVFLNEQWENSRDKTVLALGRLFDSDRKKERRQVKEYQTQLADQKWQLADQKRQLAAKDQCIKILEEQLEKAKKQ